jgi:hypothetical protein
VIERGACVFCRILEGREKASFVAQGNDAVAFLDIHPINEGHTLVVPRKHAAWIAEVDEIGALAMWTLARRIAGALRVSNLRCGCGPGRLSFAPARGPALGRRRLPNRVPAALRRRGGPQGARRHRRAAPQTPICQLT